MKIKTFFLIFIIAFIGIQVSFSQNEEVIWKLFASKENHFSIKFPDFCTEIKTSGPMSECRKETIREKGPLKFSFDVRKYSVSFGNEVIPLYSLTIYRNPENLNLKDFIYQVIMDNMKIYKAEDFNIEPYAFGSFSSFAVKYENKIGGYTGMKRELFVQREDEIYRLDLYSDWNWQYDTFFEKIVETLRIDE
jgi:hypothetical protein